MKPVCVNCKLFYRPEKNGTHFEEGRPVGSAAASWAPYKLWVGDLWKCKGCGAQIIVGVPLNSISEHYHLDYAEQVKKWRPILRVDDC